MNLYHYYDKTIGPFKSLPQVWNPDGRYGSERYVEARIWKDDVIKRYL